MVERIFRFPLKQNIGAKAAPTVVKGDKIVRGQLLASVGEEQLGANLFSSVSGTVTEVDEDEITVLADETQTDDYIKLSESDPLELIREAGIVGLGGAGFPTWFKLKDPFETEGIVLINAAECEPILGHNIAAIEKAPEKVIRGLQIVMDIVHASQGVIAIKEVHTRAVRRLRETLDDERIRIALLPDMYPMGEERAVVRECLGVNLTTTQLPSAARSVVVNLETAAKVAEAIDERKPCITKNVTVRGKLVGGNEAHVFMDVPVGVSVGELIEKAGGIDGKYGEIIMGGAFTGKSTEMDAPITKTTGAILVTMEFPDLHGAKTGLLVCACGGSEDRMREIASKMNANVVSVCRCKQAIENKPGAPLKCLRPGNCPGQVKNNLQFKKDGCEYIIIGNCSDCSNTVMASAPKMGLKVFHQTDHVMRAVGHPLYRSLKISKEVSQDIDF